MNFDGFDFDDNIKQTFNTLDIQGRVPHAVVIESRDSEKAMSLAVFLSMYAVCTAPIKPCGSCEQCHKARNKAHPDIKYVELPKDRKQNSIEQMREIIKDSIIKPNDSNAKVYIFPFADTRLSEIVQNSFLKLLEEPPQNVYFILLCENSKIAHDNSFTRKRVPPENERCFQRRRCGRGKENYKRYSIGKGVRTDAGTLCPQRQKPCGRNSACSKAVSA